MKNYLSTLLTLAAIMLLISCNGRKEQNEVPKVQNPEALQDKSELRSLTRKGSDLVDELYAELVEKSPELKELEKELADFEEVPSVTQNLFYRYDVKSNQFYANANGFASDIKDSISKKKILDFIENSSKKYDSKTKELQALVNEIADSHNTINDNHTILKIVLTLGILEKYQNENLPKTDKFLETIEMQKQLNAKVTAKTPNY